MLIKVIFSTEKKWPEYFKSMLLMYRSDYSLMFFFKTAKFFKSYINVNMAFMIGNHSELNQAMALCLPSFKRKF